MNAELLHDIPVQRLERCAAEKTGLVLSAYLAPEHLRQAASRLLEKEFFLEDVSMMEISEGYLAVYHFDHFEMSGRIALRILVSKDAPEIPTISDIYQGASWHERECRDFFGVLFSGHVNLIPLLLSAEDADLYPLRKSAKNMKSIVDLIESGDVLEQTADFTLFTAPAETSEKNDADSEEGRKIKQEVTEKSA